MNTRSRIVLSMLIGLIFALMLTVPSFIEMDRSLATSQAILDDIETSLDDIETSLADIELQLGIVPTQGQKDE